MIVASYLSQVLTGTVTVDEGPESTVVDVFQQMCTSQNYLQMCVPFCKWAFGFDESDLQMLKL